jgi:hypothetical protein
MVQMPRDAGSLATGSFAAGALVADALRGALPVAVRPVVVSVRDGRLVLGVAPAGAELVDGEVLDDRDAGDDAAVGVPDDRTLGAAVPEAGSGVPDAVADVAGHREP